MKSYKDKFIAAIQGTMKLHQAIIDGDRKSLPGTYNGCPVCNVYRGVNGTCAGCPLTAPDNGEGDTIGCTEFASFPYPSFGNWSENDSKAALDTRTAIEASRDRLVFWKKIIPILENTPAKQFTPKGWEYFYELERWW
jgi:hypothetical protein